MLFMKPGELFLKTTYRNNKKVRAVMMNKGSHTKYSLLSCISYNSKNSVLPYIFYFHVCLHVSIIHGIGF